MRYFHSFAKVYAVWCCNNSKIQSHSSSAPRRRAKPNGFTLVELAIVLMVVGVLLAGVMKGRELLQNARIGSTISQVQGFNSALDSFKKTYGAIPGDMMDPAARLPNCTAAPCTTGGNGDGRVGVTNNTHTIDQGAASENRIFWRHLAAAGLIAGVSNDYAGTPNQFGMDYPPAPIGGGWQIVYRDNGGVTPPSSHWFTSQSQLANHGSRVGVYSAAEALRVERKIDDGRWNTGSVTAFIQGGRDCGINATGNYDANNRATTPCDLEYIARVQ